MKPTLGQEPKHRRAHREQVCTGIDLRALNLLGGHVRHRSELRADSRLQLERDSGANARDTKIEDL